MPLSPRWAPTNARSWPRPPPRGLMARRRLGRSKPWTNTSGGAGNSRPRISARVAASAVAVKATVCGPPRAPWSVAGVMVLGEKAWPQLEKAVALAARQQADLPRLEHRRDFGMGEPLRRDIGEPQFAA